MANYYRLSFTAAGFMLSETISVAALYLESLDWNQVKKELGQVNLLQSNSLSRNKRVSSELILRLSFLSDKQITSMVEGSLELRRLILWYGLCKCYPILAEFSAEVLLHKFLLMDLKVEEVDVISFLNRKLAEHAELSKLSESSFHKIRTRLTGISREAGLLDLSDNILPILPSPQLINLLNDDIEFASAIFPTYPQNFKDDHGCFV